jgi:hypothetical protein
MTTTAIATVQERGAQVFSSAASFEAAQRMATALSKSTLVPKEYQGNMPNALIALEMSGRIGASPLMVMQNLYIVHGKPSWSSKFVIAAINTCGKFKPLRFHFSGTPGEDDRQCIAWTIEKNVDFPQDQVLALIESRRQQGIKLSVYEATKELGVPVLEGPAISIAIAKKEGWYQKNGSKWQSIPELMLHYRSASFFGGLYASEVLMGMQTAEEVEDYIGPDHAKNITPSAVKNADLVERFTNDSAEKAAEVIPPVNEAPTPKPTVTIALGEQEAVAATIEEAAQKLIDHLERYTSADYRTQVLDQNKQLINEIFLNNKDLALRISEFYPAPATNEGGQQ